MAACKAADHLQNTDCATLHLTQVGVAIALTVKVIASKKKPESSSTGGAEGGTGPSNSKKVPKSKTLPKKTQADGGRPTGVRV